TAWNDFAWQDQHQEGVAVRAAEIETNISAFVQRVNQMAPMASDFEVVGSATPVNVPFDNEHIESFVSQLFQTATRAVYKVDDNNVPLELSTGIVTNLVHIDVDTTHYNSISQLDFNGTDEERLRFLLDIVPAATVRKISSLSSSPWVYSALPVFGEYLDIKILVLPDMRL
ncbi:hypothetical protein GGF44_005133, partial [Coemansia sp. RSA 1694]